MNAQRIRESSVGVASCHQVIDLLRAARLGSFRLEDDVTPSEVEFFVRLLQETAHEQRSSEALSRELSVRGITHISVQPIKESEELAEELSPEQTAKRIYMRSIDAVRNVFHELRSADILFHVQRQDHDYGLLKYFMNLLGYYPLGTTARLSDGSIAIVIAGAARPELRHLPKVRLILDPDGRAAKGETVDLARTAEAGDKLHIAETVNAKDYGIEVMDYILQPI